MSEAPPATPRRSAPAPLLQTTPVDRVAGLFLLGATSILWTWWALAEGAFFGTVLWPGGIVLYLLLAVLLGFAPLRIRSGGPHELAFLALIGLALWTIASIAWTPARDFALDDTQRVLIYAAAFAAGLWLTNMLRQRMALSVLPLAIAGGVVCLTTIVIGWTGSAAATLLDEENTLDFPLGYRNADACFLVMVAMVGLAVMARHRGRPAIRCAGAALAAASISLAVLSQSRGSAIGLIVGLIAFLALSPQRSRALIATLIVVVPAALTVPWMLAPFDAPLTGDGATSALHVASAAAALAALAAAALGFVAISLEGRIRGGIERFERTTSHVLAALAALLLLAGAAGLVATSTDPVRWVGDRIQASDRGQAPESSSRFLYTGGLQRSDFWRVALDEFSSAPLLGDGSGAFRTTYLEQRRSDQSPKDAHSIELELLGELGAPGLLLLGFATLAAALGIRRSRKLGPEAMFVGTVGLTVGATYLAQSSIDWFWSYPGLTAPVFALIGSAAAPQAYALGEAASSRRRRSGVAVALIMAVTLVPMFISERLTTNAAEQWRNNPNAALARLDTAAAANPLADLPLLVKATIASQIGRTQVALDALEAARTRQPEEYQNYELAAQILAPDDPAAAIAQAKTGLELNPRDMQLAALIKRLERKLSRSPAGAP